MPTPSKILIDLETRFWQSMVDEDTDAALQILSEPALMVSAHGAMKFDHQAYRKMAEQGPSVLTAFELSDMDVVFPNDATAVITYRVKQRLAPRGEGKGNGKGKSTVQEMNDTSTWIRKGDRWECVMHTETPAGSSRAN